jgi:hypothetical protein
MIAENKRAKLRKLAELFRAKRAITLAEKRQRKENTLALVKQFAAEARAKRGLQEPPNTPEEVEEVVGDPKDPEEDIENKDTPIPKELVPVPDSGPITNDTDFLYNEYYRIPDYTNKYDTDDMLVIGRSKIPGAGLGLFAFVTIEQRNHPGYKHLWIKKKDWISAKFLLFKGYPRAHKKSTYIDEYKGEIIQTQTEEEMDEILDANQSDKTVHISKTCVIDANAPTSCYAAYANDPRRGSGFRYNAA